MTNWLLITALCASILAIGLILGLAHWWFFGGRFIDPDEGIDL